MVKKMKAPKYFLEAKAEARATMEGVQKEVLGQSKVASKGGLGEVLEILMDKMRYAKEVADTIQDYAWARFRLENLSNVFGKADHLTYDPKTKMISVNHQ